MLQQAPLATQQPPVPVTWTLPTHRRGQMRQALQAPLSMSLTVTGAAELIPIAAAPVPSEYGQQPGMTTVAGIIVIVVITVVTASATDNSTAVPAVQTGTPAHTTADTAALTVDPALAITTTGMAGHTIAAADTAPRGITGLIISTTAALSDPVSVSLHLQPPPLTAAPSSAQTTQTGIPGASTISLWPTTSILHSQKNTER